MTRLWVSKLNLLTAAAVPLAPPVALITNGNISNGLQEHVIDANAEKISSNIIIKALGMIYAYATFFFFSTKLYFPKIFLSCDAPYRYENNGKFESASHISHYSRIYTGISYYAYFI